MSYTAEHFEQAGEVWAAYFSGKISQRLREDLLKQLRAVLAARVSLPN